MLKQNIMLTSAQLQTLLENINTAKVGGKTTVINITGDKIGVVSAAAYSSGDILGTKNPIEIECLTSDNGTAIIQSLVIGDLDAQNGAIDVIVFNSSPSATTFTDNTALDINDADLTKIIHGGISITSTNYKSYSNNSVATLNGIGVPAQNVSTSTGKKNTLWVAFVSRDSKTYSSNNAISAKIGFLQD